MYRYRYIRFDDVPSLDDIREAVRLGMHEVFESNKPLNNTASLARLILDKKYQDWDMYEGDYVYIVIMTKTAFKLHRVWLEHIISCNSEYEFSWPVEQ